MIKQSYTFDDSKLASFITLTIISVYPTEKWEDTALSGIEFYLDGREVEIDCSAFAQGLEKQGQ